MRIALALLMIAHGIAHLVGFVVPWRLKELPEVPHRTTILQGTVDLGETGVRVYGCAWLVLGVAFAALAAGTLFRATWWYRGSLVAVGVSTLFCVLSWPETRFGVLANVLILVLAVAGVRLGWLDIAAK
jgi:cytochrome c biogenesis protein ResB